MSSRGFAWLGAVAIAIALLSSVDLAVAGQAPAAWTVPRTAGGQPDLQGVWSNNSVTPLERPDAFAGKAVLTDLELAELKRRAASRRILEPFLARGRDFTPRLERASSRPPRWHLVVSVDGVPCFSAHYPSERAAIAAWAKFKRQQARR